jgi:5-methyltetrahydrofolate corrinoid/iron sulfur protein methyltransferase
MNAGLDSAIVNAAETELVAFARGKKEDMVCLIQRVMDGEQIDVDTLSPEAADYVKTARVLLGQSLYSHSWLKL